MQKTKASQALTLKNSIRIRMIEQLMALPHKDGVHKEDWPKVKNNLIIIALAVAFFCFKRKLPLLFTSIIREGIPGVSTSKTHIEGRAFDISVKGWKDSDIFDLVYWINETFEIGAVSASTGKESAAIYEPREYWKEGEKLPTGKKVGDLKKEAHLHFQSAKAKTGFRDLAENIAQV